MDPKVGVYICKGCDIAKKIDIDKLAEAANEQSVAICKNHDILCSQAGTELIQNDIKNDGINRVVVAACSGRVFPEAFDFGKDVFTDRTNIREQVAWCHSPADASAMDEDIQVMADDYVKMGIAKVMTGEPPEPHIEETSKDILVVGGGITGLTAAKAASDAGYKVIVVEKEAELGGWAGKFPKVFPKHPPYQALEDSGLTELVAEVEKNSNITVHKSTTIAKTTGQPGLFEVSLQNGSASSQIKVGAIIQATGWKPYDASKLGKWGHGVSPDVITNIQMEEMASKGEIKRPSDGKAIESIAFIQCAGSRDEEHLPYCSAVCCRVSLKQALYVREKYPDAKIYVIYKDLRSPAQYELFYAHIQDDDAIFMTKGEIAGVTKSGDKLAITVNETLLGEDIKVEVDMAVLATGMVPTTKADEVPEAEKSEPAEGENAAAEEADGEKEKVAVVEPEAKILNLAYRQGTDLPTLKYGFPDSHFVCFPFETRRTAIYAAGAVRAPMDFASDVNDAYGAALKAIQAVESVAKGQAVHPRSGDVTFPEFTLKRCTQCKRCTEECPFGTLDEDEKGTPLPNPFRCRRCGVCLGACPERIINFKNYNIEMMSQMVKAITIPDEWDEKPRLLCFVCENDAMPALEMAGIKRLEYNAMIRFIPLRCLGSLNIIWINDALSSGFDGILLFGCKKGDDYQCHFIRGSELANTRMDNVKDKLKQLALEEERVQVHEIAISDYNKIPKIIDDMLEVINTIGMNPFKGM